MMLVVVAGALEGALGAQGQWRWMVDMLALLISILLLVGIYLYACVCCYERVRDAMVDMLALLISMINPSLGGDIFIRLCMREGAYTYVYKCMVLRERVRDAMGM